MSNFSDFQEMIKNATDDEMIILKEIFFRKLGLSCGEVLPQSDSVIISGSSHPTLASEIAVCSNIPLLRRELGKFYNDELQVQLKESVRRRDVYIIQSVASTWHNGYTVNDNLVELLLMIDATRRAAAASISAVVTHYCYSKQDQKFSGRQPISAKLIANLIQAAGASRVITIDLHAAGIQGFFDIPVDNLFMIHLMLTALKDHMGVDSFDITKYRVLSPDVGGVSRARWVAEFLKLLLSIAFKRRPEKDVAEVTEMVGNVENKIVLTPDDLISSGGTVEEIHDYAVFQRGVKEIIPLITHPSPKKEAIEKILKCSNIQILVVADTIPIDPGTRIPHGKKLIVVSPASIIALAIMQNQLRGGSVSQLFDMDPKKMGLKYRIMSSNGIQEFSCKL